jgi:hypothetical protein
MLVHCDGRAIIEHAETGEQYTILPDQVDWQDPEGDDRNMGPEFSYVGEVWHDALGSLSWTLLEYPVGVQNYAETDVGDHKVIEDFDYSLVPDDE